MNIYFYIIPRQCGKSHFALYEYRKKPENSIIVTPCNNDFFKRANVNVCKQPIYLKELSELKTIIFDEYLMFEPKLREQFHNELRLKHDIENIIVLTTPNMIYDKNKFNYICDYKKDNRGIPFHKNLILEDFLKQTQMPYKLSSVKPKAQDIWWKEFEELYHNLLTEPLTKIITDKNFNQYLYNSERIKAAEELKKTLQEKTFQTEIQCIFLRDNISNISETL